MLKKLSILCLISFIILSGAANAQDKKPAKNTIKPVPAAKKQQAGQIEKFILTINGKIIKGTAIKQNGITFIDAALLKDGASAFGAKSEFDPAEKVLSLTFESDIKEIPSIQQPAGAPFLIVQNGKIHKTCFIEKAGSIFIPLASAEAVFTAAGAETEKDLSAGIVTVTKKDIATTTSNQEISKQDNKPDLKQSKPIKDISKDLPKDVSKDVANNVKKATEYLNALKKIIDETKPSKMEEETLDTILNNLGSSKRKNTDINPITKKYGTALSRLRELTPPDKETKVINNLAEDIFGKLIKATSLVDSVMKSDEGLDISNAVQEIFRLNKEISKESENFNQKVKQIKEKYKMENP